MDTIIWLGILFCITQSAMFSGLNLAFFSVTRLRLEIEVANNNPSADKVLHMRNDSNFLLATILWGNVGINVLLTLLSNSVMAGAAAFIFSTFLITFLGEIIPQAYFSRHALKMAALLAPVLKIYQVILYIVAKPSAIMLDKWLGAEGIEYFREKSLKQLIRKHMEESHDIDIVEGLGAINFLALDDLKIKEEGRPIDPDSIIQLPFSKDKPVFPKNISSSEDEFVKSVHKSGRKWVVLIDEDGNPKQVMDADGYLRSALIDPGDTDPMNFLHRPIVIRDSGQLLGEVLKKFEIEPVHDEDFVIDRDIVLLWSERKQIITGSDILGRLLHGISARLENQSSKNNAEVK